MAITDNLQAAYVFNSDLNDSSGNGRNLSLAAGSVSYPAGKVNNAVTLGTTNDPFRTGGAFAVTTAFTYVGWIKTSTTGTTKYLYQMQGGSPFRELWARITTGNAVRVYFDPGTGTTFDQTSSDSTYCDGNWHFIAVVYDGSTVKMYHNSTSSTVINTAYTQAQDMTTSQDLYIGYDYAGDMDAVGLWSRALSTAELDLCYNAGAGQEYPWPSPVTTNSQFFGAGI